jgi:hypothetical protein
VSYSYVIRRYKDDIVVAIRKTEEEADKLVNYLHSVDAANGYFWEIEDEV